MAKPCPSECTGSECLRERFPGRCGVSVLAFPPLPFCTSLSARWLAPWGGKQKGAACQGRNRIPERVCSCSPQPSAALASPAPSGEQSRAPRQFCSVTSQEEEAGRGRMISVCLPSPVSAVPCRCNSCLLTLSVLPERSFVNVAGVWKPFSSVMTRLGSV